MTIEGLRYARAVCESGSFSAAARGFGVTQPSLSSGIARLEDTLGERLFDRTPRGVSPTPFGELMLPLIDRALAAVDAVAAEAVRWNPPVDESIRLGVSPLISPALVARAYAAVRDLPAPGHPWQLVLREANMAELRDALVAGHLDLVVIPSVGPMPRYEHRVIDSEPLFLVDPRAEPEPGVTGAGRVELRELVDRQFILLPDTCGLTAFTRDLMTSHDLPVRPYPGEASSYQVLENWSLLGLGVAVLPESKLSGPASSRRAVCDDGEPVEIFYEAVWDPHSAHADALRTVAETLQQAGRGRGTTHSRAL